MTSNYFQQENFLQKYLPEEGFQQIRILTIINEKYNRRLVVSTAPEAE